MIIKIKLDTSNAEELNALSALVQSLGGKTIPVNQPPTPEKPKTGTKTQTPKKEEVKPSITLGDLKKLVREKTESNKENYTAAKEKITEWGFDNVSKMDPEKYDEFKDFLEALP